MSSRGGGHDFPHKPGIDVRFGERLHWVSKSASRRDVDLTTPDRKPNSRFGVRNVDKQKATTAPHKAAAREEPRKTAEAAAADKLAEGERIRQEMQTGLQQQVAQAEAARLAAEQAGANLQTQFQRLLKDSQAALAAAKAEAQVREVEI